MIYINKKLYINNLVLRAKIGNKKDFEKLRGLYFFLIEDIFRGFCKAYPFLKSRRMDIFNEFYFFFWDAIKTHNYSSEVSFSYHLKESLIENARQIMCTYYGYSIENIVKKEVIKAGIIKKKTSKNRKIVNNFFIMLSPKRKFLIYLHCYRNLTYNECRNYTKSTRSSILTTVERTYKAIRKNLRKIPTRNKKIIYRERLHKIYQEKIGDFQ